MVSSTALQRYEPDHIHVFLELDPVWQVSNAEPHPLLINQTPKEGDRALYQIPLDPDEITDTNSRDSRSPHNELGVVNSLENGDSGGCVYGPQHEEDDFGNATWEEVCLTCCSHTAEEWLLIGCCIIGIVVLFYFFLFGVEMLGTGARVMSGCQAGELLGDDNNPIAGLMVGILATVLLQSSSTTTSIIVSLIGDAISVQQGIFMVMGANIGTSVTNTIVAMGQMGDDDQFERAFAGATVHDMFNFLTVGILLPLEVATGYLEVLTGAMVKNAVVKDGEKWEGPVKKVISPLGRRIIISNTMVSESIANGEKECEDFYPNSCTGNPTYKSCGGKFGLIKCDENSDSCPLFFSEGATPKDDKVSGGIVFFISILVLFTCLLGIVSIVQKLLLGVSNRIVYKATDVNGYVAMVIGAGITMLLQSSSITTSTLTPLVGMGAVRLEQMYPLTLGANLGTTLTGILAAMVSDTIQSLQVALAHLFFNVSGICIFFPLPFMRQIPLGAARFLGGVTRLWRGFPLIYIFTTFVAFPLVFLGLSALFEKGTKAYKVLGSILVFVLVAIVAHTIVVLRHLRRDSWEALEMRERT